MDITNHSDMPRCDELLGPFRCELDRGHLGRCRFDSHANIGSVSVQEEAMTIYKTIAQRLWDENFAAEVSTAEKTTQRIADVIEEEFGKAISRISADRPVAEIVGSIVRKTYGDYAELGHYKITSEAFHLGREGVLALMGALGKTKLRLEAIQKAWSETDLSFKSDLCDQYRELYDALKD